MKKIISVWKKPRVALTIFIVVAVLTSIATLRPERDQPAPEISFTLINGNKLSLNGLRGRPVLVFFWATTCKICVAKIPQMNTLYRRLNPKGLEMIAVAMPYDPPTIVVSMAARKNMTYPVALDINAEVVRAFGNVTVTPTTFLIGPEGNVIWRKLGKFDIDRLETRIQELIRTHKAI